MFERILSLYRASGEYSPKNCPACGRYLTLVDVHWVRARATGDSVEYDSRWCWPCVFGERVLYSRIPIEDVISGRVS